MIEEKKTLNKRSKNFKKKKIASLETELHDISTESQNLVWKLLNIFIFITWFNLY